MQVILYKYPVVQLPERHVAVSPHNADVKIAKETDPDLPLRRSHHPMNVTH